MRRVWLLAGLFLAAMMSGCMADSDGDEDSMGDGSQQTGGATGGQAQGEGSTSEAVAIGDDRGTITYYDEDTVSAVLTQPDCANGGGITNNYEWNIPSADSAGVAWKASELTVTVTGSESAVDLDLYLTKDGEELGSNTETGLDEEDSVSVTVQDVTPGALKITVQVCTTAPQASYTIDGTADMVATEARAAGSTSAASSSGDSTTDASKVSDVTVEQKTDGDGNIYYEARRTETYTATLTGSTGDAAVSTGGGVIDYDGGRGDDYKLVADLKARGTTEQQAKDRLAEMYVDHNVQDGSSVVLDVHGRAGGDGSWNNKQIDMAFDAPKDIDWATFSTSSGGGIIEMDQVTGTDVSATTGGGIATVTNSDADSLDVDTGGGVVTIENTVTDTLDATTGGGIITLDDVLANSMDLLTGGGIITADMQKSTASGDWDITTGGGSIDLTLVEASTHGYSIDASNPSGSINFDFDEIEETSDSCSGGTSGYCPSREAETPGYESRDIVVMVDMDSGGGSINARS